MKFIKVVREIEWYKTSCEICGRELSAITEKQLRFNYKRHKSKHKKENGRRS